MDKQAAGGWAVAQARERWQATPAGGCGPPLCGGPPSGAIHLPLSSAGRRSSKRQWLAGGDGAGGRAATAAVCGVGTWCVVQVLGAQA
jgi:hypothetical protein